MDFLDHLVIALAITCAVSFTMVWLATRFHQLEERRPERRCPACGLLRSRGRCGCTH